MPISGINSLLSLALSGLLLSCSGGGSQNEPTYGSVKIAADESLRDLIEQERIAFEGIYQNSNIEVFYHNEMSVVEGLLKDSVDLAIITRPLNEEEEQSIHEQKIWPEMVKVAYDGIAVLVHPSNPDSSITTTELHRILTGEITTWNELKETGFNEPVTVIFDQDNGGVARYIRDSIARADGFPKNVFAVNGNQQVIDYVKQNSNAIGFIGVNWISDSSPEEKLSFKNEVKVASIASDADGLYYKPYQAYIAQKTYSLIRPVYAINREGRAGLASGFTAFLASERGQRIILKSGLVPVTMPLRIVQLPDKNTESNENNN